MAKLYLGTINYASTMHPTGAQPLDDRTVVASFNDLLSSETFGLAKYNGMLVAVVEDKQVYMLVDETKATEKESWVAVGSGNGSVVAPDYDAAKGMASNDNLGQIIYVSGTSETYIVTGEQNLLKLAASTAQNLDEVVNTLQTKVSALETSMGTAETEIAGIKGRMDTAETTLANKVDKDGDSRLMTTEEGKKLAEIAAGAQANVIEVIKVNNEVITVDNSDKSVSITIPSAPIQGVASGENVLSLVGDTLKTNLTLRYVPATTNHHAVLRLEGKDGAVVTSIDATAFVKDGMISKAELTGPKDDETGEKYLSIVFHTSAGDEEVRAEVSELIDYYTNGNGLDLNGKEFSIKLDNSSNDYLQVGVNGLSVSQTLVNKITDSSNNALSAATAYTESNFVKLADFNEFEEDYETKLQNIEENAEVNKINAIEVNGVAATVDEDRLASVKIDAGDIELGIELTADGQKKYDSTDKLSTVLQGIQNSITNASGGAYLGVVSGNGISVSDVVGNQQTISARISTSDYNMLSFSEADGGLFAAMYYDGDDAE